MNAALQDGSTPLLLACCEGHFNVAYYFADTWDADIHVTDTDGCNVLHFCCAKRGNLDHLESFVRRGCTDIAKPTNEGLDTLMIACQYGHLGIVDYLIGEFNMSVSFRGLYHRRTPLHMACAFGQLAVVDYLVEDCQVSLTDRDDQGWTAWFHACGKDGSVDVMKYLLEETDEVDTSARDVYGSTAICQAVSKLDSLRYYHKHCPNADANESNHDDQRPLHFACNNDECPLEVVKYLVEECKVDVGVKDNEGCLPLHFASAHGSQASNAVIQYLVNECGCFDQVNVGNKEGETPMHLACQHDDLDLVYFLVRFDGGASLLSGIPRRESSDMVED